MQELVLHQLVVICLSWFIALIFWNFSVAISVLLGELTYFLPSLLSVIALIKIRKTPNLLCMSLLIVEFYKIVLIIVMITTIYLFGSGIHWIGYTIGLVIITQVGLLMFRKNVVCTSQ